MIFTSKSVIETENIGHQLAASLELGDNISLTGDLGAGKSVLCRAVLNYFNISGLLPSPSFTIINQYKTALDKKEITFHHIDLYRLSDEDEIINIGLEEILNDSSISLIEWGEKAEFLFHDNIKYINIKIIDQDRREIQYK